MEIKVKKLVPGAVMPTRAHATDAGFDLVAVSRTVDDDGAAVYGTGLAFEIPEGYVGLVFPRSSIARNDLTLSNCVGVVDAGYRGEVMAKFKPSLRFERLPHGALGAAMRCVETYDIGERIAQLVVMKLPDVQLVEVEELSESERGSGGYGSSGK